MKRSNWFLALALVATGCGANGTSRPADGGSTTHGGDFDDGGDLRAADAGTSLVDGGYAVGDAGILRADRFITKVVSFTPGPCAGFGIPQLPGIVMGPPVGGGQDQGSTDVVSLGNAGEIVVSFEPNAIVDGPGVDFIVFENPFDIGGDPTRVYAEPGEVSVSDDGVTWQTYACVATSPPYGGCAGWHVVYSNPANGISPVDAHVAGGDAFDLADLGVTRVRFIRIRDKTHEACPPAPARVNTNGFDLDAISIINAETP